MINKMILTFFIIICCAVGLSAQPPGIKVVYPKAGSFIGAADSSFIFGEVTPGSGLFINGTPVKVHKDGGFLAFLPLTPGSFSFQIVAVNKVDTTILFWPVIVPEPRETLPFDSLTIIDRTLVNGDQYMTIGDLIKVEIQGVPGCDAWFSIPGLVDSVPMAEINPRVQTYWGETVFGTGAVPDSMKIKGIYQGFYRIDRDISIDSARICYFIKAPDYSSILNRIIETPLNHLDMSILNMLRFENQLYQDSSRFLLFINSPQYPRLVKFTDSVQTVRVGPRQGYYSIFQPEGVKAMAVGADGDWLKLRLSETQFGWVDRKSVEFLAPGQPAPSSLIRSIRIDSTEGGLQVEIPLTDRHPYRVEEETPSTIFVDLFGVTSDTDWIKYHYRGDELKLAQWSQIEPGQYRLKLEFDRPIWGYDLFYESNILKFRVKSRLQGYEILKDMKVVIDPGHSPDPGAVGPTGLTESVANLGIALALEKELRKRGADVILTRDDMSDLPLYDRPKIALVNDADLFISIHNNALPDGVNPFENNGFSTYYYHPHSIDLARSIHDEMLKIIDLPDHGYYYGNLAVNRPTQYPAVLIECAFMMIPEQEAMLKTGGFQKKLAVAIRRGIEKFLEDRTE